MAFKPGTPPRVVRRGGLLQVNLLRTIAVWTGRLITLACVIPILQVLLLRWVDPPLTLTMLDRALSGDPIRWPEQERLTLYQTGYAARAAVAAEDARFFHHHGFDMAGICLALRANARAARSGSDRLRGGSTISQQVARNVFLWQERSWLRKGLEVGYTVLLEALIPKTRILEVYLNVAETGDHLFGVGAAARRYYHRSAADLSPDQAARIIAILPSPRKWSVSDPKIAQKAARAVAGAVPFPGEPGFSEAARKYREDSPWPWECF